MTKHPAKYSDPILPILARYVDGARTILDPFAGTGRIGHLRHRLSMQATILANEMEPEWADQCTANGCDFARVGDARDLPWGSETLDAVVTSPTYGNRMADSCDWAPGRKHSTYHGSLGRRPSAGSSAVMQWGDDYRELHRSAWREAWRVLIPGGRLVVNVADHYRDAQLQRVPEWHVSALLAIGFVLLDAVDVETQRYGFGANAELRAPEQVIVMEKPGGEYGVPAFTLQPVRGYAGPLADVTAEPVQLNLLDMAPEVASA